MERLSMEGSKELFEDLAHVVIALENYEKEQTEKNKLKLDLHLLTKDTMLLPSGKWGNLLALALEMHKFKSANYILENREKFQISLDYIAFELDKKGAVIHFEDELDFAVSYYNLEGDFKMVEEIEKLLSYKRLKR
ncbi:MAG: hypothetical protein J6B98_05800 [Bacilli bacterium]|nr:hypothetical protein [Bacilli bacterium]